MLAECARVLGPGGRLTVSDLTVDEEELPSEILTPCHLGRVSGRRADGA